MREKITDESIKKVDEAEIIHQYLDMEIDMWCHTWPRVVLVYNNEEYLLEFNSLDASFYYMQYITNTSQMFSCEGILGHFWF